MYKANWAKYEIVKIFFKGKDYGQNDTIKKLLFFDVDDTLVDSKTGKVPESTIEALHNLRKMVTKFVYLQVDLYLIKLIHQSFFDVPWDGYVCFNGQGLLQQRKSYVL